MFLSLILSLAVSARAEQNTQLSYRQLREGQPATLTPQQVEDGRLNLNSLKQKLITAWTASVKKDACPDFDTALIRLTASIDDTFEAWRNATDPDKRLLNRIRLQLLIPVVSLMHDLFKSKAEAGYGTIDRQPYPTCLRHRESVAAPFAAYATFLSQFQADALGVEGMLTLTQEEDDLLKIASSERVRRGHYDAEMIVATTASSIVLWSLVPWAAAAISARAALISVPEFMTASVVVRGGQLLTSPLALRGGVVGLNVIENLSYNAIDQKLNPPAGEVTPNQTLSYAEFMDGFENLIEAPLESPELYFVYLSGIKSQLVQTQAHWLNEHHAELHLGREWNTVVAEAREALASGGTSLEDAQSEIRNRLHNDFRLDVTCQTGVFAGLNEPDCLRGLRQVLRALQKMLTPSSPSVGQVFTIRIGDHFEQFNDKDSVTLEVPLDSTELVGQIEAARSSAAVHGRVLTLEALQQDTATLQSVLGPTIGFDPKLTRAERWQSVRRLTAVLRQHPNLAERVSKAWNIGLTTSALVERHLTVEENIDARADEAALLNYLSLSPNTQLLAQIENIRQEIDASVRHLRATHGWDGDCNPRGRLSLKMCAFTLRCVQTYLDTHSEIKALPGNVLIADLADINQALIHFPDPQTGADTLVIRTDFRPEQLIGYGLRVGWLQAVGAR